MAVDSMHTQSIYNTHNRHTEIRHVLKRMPHTLTPFPVWRKRKCHTFDICTINKCIMAVILFNKHLLLIVHYCHDFPFHLIYRTFQYSTLYIVHLLCNVFESFDS